jgi:hypothetical protein
MGGERGEGRGKVRIVGGKEMEKEGWRRERGYCNHT